MPGRYGMIEEQLVWSGPEVFDVLCHINFMSFGGFKTARNAKEIQILYVNECLTPALVF